MHGRARTAECSFSPDSRFNLTGGWRGNEQLFWGDMQCNKRAMALKTCGDRGNGNEPLEVKTTSTSHIPIWILPYLQNILRKWTIPFPPTSYLWSIDLRGLASPQVKRRVLHFGFAPWTRLFERSRKSRLFRYFELKSKEHHVETPWKNTTYWRKWWTTFCALKWHVFFPFSSGLQILFV